jgi:hypothetical protein
VAHPILVDKSKIYVPPLHIKLGLIKVIVKAVDKETERFGYLRPRRKREFSLVPKLNNYSKNETSVHK